MTFTYTKHRDEVLFIPLGGTSEIGINCSLYHQNGKWLMVDLGIGFTGADLPGIDVIVPDLSVIKKFKDDIEGLIITHAHEDHLGAVPYLIDELSCNIYANKFSAAVLKAKLRENNKAEYADKIKEFENDSKFKIGSFEIEAINLTHSIPDMSSLLIKTKVGSIYHTGDWKLDKDPLICPETNLEKLKKIGDNKVLAMVCDSTNIFSEGVSGSEGDLQKSLIDLVADLKKGLVIVTTFASNIARMQSILTAAELAKREVVMAGRSMWRMYRAAKDCGYFSDIKKEPLDIKDVKSINKDKTLLLVTGCQGEERAIVARLARDAVQNLSIGRGDTIIFASKIIPGNERGIYDMMNLLAAKGVEVMTEKDHFVHVSGHPSRDEMKEMYKLIRPRFAIPVHGETMHIHEHIRFAKMQGVEDAITTGNGAVLKLTPEEIFKVGYIKTKYLGVDGNYLIPTDSDIIRDRLRLSANGIVVVSFNLRNLLKFKEDPYIIGPGIIDSEQDQEVINEMKELVSEVARVGSDSLGVMKKSIVKALRKFIRSEYGKDPIVEVLVDRSE